MSTPFRWGFLGTARIGQRRLSGLHEAGQVVAIVGSRDPERAKARAAEFTAERGGSYEDVLAATDVDAVYIPLPNPFHPQGDLDLRVTIGSGERIVTVPEAHHYAREFANFERNVRAGAPSPTPGTDAIGTQAVIAAWRAG